MFAEINRNSYRGLPFLLTTIAQNQPQSDIDRPQGFGDHQFIWVSKGEGLFTVGGEEHVLSVNRGAFFRSNTSHSYKGCSRDFETCWLTFTGCESILEYYGIQESFLFDVSPALGSITEDLNVLCSGSSTVVTRSASGYSWLVSVLEELFAPSIPTEIKVRQFMEDFYDRPLTLEEIAAHVNMNRYSLCRYYHQKCGIKLMDQLKKIRVSKAKHYLQYSTKPLEEIGRLCGFESASYFGKRFKEETKLSPSEYRKKNK